MNFLQLETNPVTIDLSPIVDALTGSITVGSVVTIIASIVTATIGFVLAWKMAKKLYRAFASAITGRAGL